LAIRYLDRSPLEQHHIATTFKILKKEEFNIVKNIAKSDYLIFRKNVISNILYTDNKEHFKNLKNFEEQFKETYEVIQTNLSYFGVYMLKYLLRPSRSANPFRDHPALLRLSRDCPVV